MHEMVTIRPLEPDDYKVSYKWRNNPAIWQYTGTRPDKLITEEIEKEWLSTVLQRKDERRFAICVDSNYIGNIQLTSIANESAEYHIFIGEQEYWGKGIAAEASHLLLRYGFDVLGLNCIYLSVKEDNLNAIKLYERLSFRCAQRKEGLIKMLLYAEWYPSKG
jgi:RimJ/RimL family protein N-acetyltransferase